MDSNQGVDATVGHGLQIAGDAAVRLGELGLAEAAGDFLLDLAHAQVALGAVIGEGDVRVLGEQQHGGFVFFQALPEVMGIGFCDSAPLAILLCRDGRQFALATGEEVAVVLLKALVLARSEPFALALGDTGAGLPQEPLHVASPGVAVGLDDEGELAQQMRATQPMAAVRIGQVGGPAVMDDHPSVARDDADRRHRLQSALRVHELQGDLPCRADVDPVIVLLHTDGGLIEMHRRWGEDALDGHLLPAGQRQVQLQHVLEDRGLGDHKADQALDRLLHALEREHLGDQQVQRVCLDARTVLHGARERLGERRAGLGAAVRARLDLGVEVAHDLLEDDVDPGAPLVPVRSHIAQILPAFLAGADLGDLNGLDGAGVRRAARVADPALGMGAEVADRALVLLGSGGGLAGVRAALGGVLFHEHRQEHLHQHQQRLDQGAAFGADLAVGGQLPEALLERRELLAQGLLVDARHEVAPGGLLASLDGHQPREHRQALPGRQRPVALRPALRLALDALPLGVVLAGVARPMHPLGAEVEPDLLGAHPTLVHHLHRKAAPADQPLVVQGGGVAGEHHLARQARQQPQQLDVIALLVLEPVAPLRGARRMQIRRIAVDEFLAPIVKVRQEPVRAAVHPLHRILALEFLQGALIEVDANVAQCRRLALHDRPAAEVTLDVGLVRGHQRDDRLAQPRGRLGSEICAHRRRTRTLPKMGPQRRIKSLRCQASVQWSGSVRA